MTQPIMSRFDLIFILADTSNSSDRALAERLTELHKSGEGHSATGISTSDFLLYLEYARTVEPKLTENACALLASSFRDLRSEKTRTVTHRMFRYTTRQLESMIRLSEAVARLHLDTEVRTAHVNIALTLMRASMTHTELAGNLSDDVDIVARESGPTQDVDGDAASPARIRDEVRTLLASRVCDPSVSAMSVTLAELSEWCSLTAPGLSTRIGSDALRTAVKDAVMEMARTGLLTRVDAPAEAEFLDTDRFTRGSALQ